MQTNHTFLDTFLNTPLGTAAYNVCSIIQNQGYECYWVGGSVRDILLERPVTDIDIATNALPEQIATLFTNTTLENSTLGAVIIEKNGFSFEVTTFRKESNTTTGRTPTNIEFTNRTEDALRRDFTINALYFDPITQKILDDVQGLVDIHEKIVRFIGDATERIVHDPLRSLRAIRLRNAITGQYHPATYHAIHANAVLTSNLSGMRVQQELEKMLLGPNPSQCLEDAWETDILEHIIPELSNCKGVAQPSMYHAEGDVWEHTLQTVQSSRNEDDIDVRIAALFHDIGKATTFSIEADRIHFNNHASVSAATTEQILNRLQYPAKRIQKICWLIEHHMMMSQLLELTQERKRHWYFHEWFTELLQLFWLDIAGTSPSNFTLYDEIIADYTKFLDAHPAPKKPLLTGEEIIEILQIEPGPIVGEILTKLANARINNLVNYKAEAIEFVKNITL